MTETSAKTSAKTAESTPAESTPAPSIQLVEVDASLARGAGRPSEPNPFADAIAKMHAAWNDKANESRKSFRFQCPADDVSKNKRRITEAAHALTPPRSPRFAVTKNDDGTVSVTFSIGAKVARSGAPANAE